MRRGAKPEKVKSGKSLKDPTPEVRELETRLAETLDQQTATSEILRVISGSPADAQPVFDTIVRNAARLCGTVFSGISLQEGDQLPCRRLTG